MQSMRQKADLVICIVSFCASAQLCLQLGAQYQLLKGDT